MSAKVVRDALTDLLAGGIVAVYVESGEMCLHPREPDTGVIVGGNRSRAYLSSLTLRRIKPYLAHSPYQGPVGIDEKQRPMVRLLAAGRDVLTIASTGAETP